MQLKVFAIDAHGGEEAGEELNQFLRGHRVLGVKRRLVEHGSNAYWTFCVEYLERGGTPGGPGGPDRLRRGVDYRELLSEGDFAVFAKLRDLRKAMAEQEGVPPYAVFTNEQLAAMVTGRTATRAALAQIDGVGVARLEKYATAFTELLKSALAALPATPAAAAQGKEAGP
ncbi:MAG: HRDC domain-containing protein [Verrucomicrobia bacterium]|nr:HRDC domain-containing protein [Verrucomicrobiota bacterium]